ncbi:MAG: hypothetical protein AAFM91_17245 [Pseudomonadota bacterium]
MSIRIACWYLPVCLAITACGGGGGSTPSTADEPVAPPPANTAERSEVVIDVDSKARTYTLYVPAAYEAGNPAVVLLHGGSQSMRAVLEDDVTSFRWVDLADAEGFLVIAPNGFNNALDDGLGDSQSWNDLRDDRSGNTSLQDDRGFILQVLDHVHGTTGFDLTRVLVSGASNGGMMAMRLLIESPERFAGGAVFIAALPEEPIPNPAEPTPIFLLNGTEDSLVLFDGGIVGRNGAPTRSVPDTVAYWVAATGSDANQEQVVDLPDSVPTDACTLTETTYSSLVSGLPTVRFIEAIGGGHNTPDPSPPFRNQAVLEIIGNECRDAHGVDLAWAFLQQYL